MSELKCLNLHQQNKNETPGSVVPSTRYILFASLPHLLLVLDMHLCALKSMGREPSASFITSLIEMKLDPDTMFEWQKASQDSSDVLYFVKLPDFLNLRAQASESA